MAKKDLRYNKLMAYLLAAKAEDYKVYLLWFSKQKEIDIEFTGINHHATVF